MLFIRRRPTASLFVNRSAFRNIRQGVIDEQTVLVIHKCEVARVICRDDRFAEQHRLRQTETKTFRAMERDKTIAQVDVAIGPRTRREFIYKQHPIFIGEIP